MYNERERIIHHRQLLSKESAAADLRLLQEKDPKNPHLTEFGLSPARLADEILFALLAVASRDEIVKNRLSSKETPAEETPAEEAPAEETPTEENPVEEEAKKKVKSPSPKKKSTKK
ncbi:MAG: hypothetical protein IJ552_11675 [Prevotella sp.]|nr:hypothetical protein [Prevotella sp.]